MTSIALTEAKGVILYFYFVTFFDFKYSSIFCHLCNFPIHYLGMSRIFLVRQETIMAKFLYRIQNRFRRKKLLKHSKYIVVVLKKILQGSTILQYISESAYCMMIACSARHENIVKVLSIYVEYLSTFVFLTAIRFMIISDLETFFSVLFTLYPFIGVNLHMQMDFL